MPQETITENNTTVDRPYYVRIPGTPRDGSCLRIPAIGKWRQEASLGGRKTPGLARDSLTYLLFFIGSNNPCPSVFLNYVGFQLVP